ncbi:15130_t:CDS:2 [Funneliformis geosporum]|nr:15130_t:CDS:2 [Funneliformis geosporum]
MEFHSGENFKAIGILKEFGNITNIRNNLRNECLTVNNKRWQTDNLNPSSTKSDMSIKVKRIQDDGVNLGSCMNSPSLSTITLKVVECYLHTYKAKENEKNVNKSIHPNQKDRIFNRRRNKINKSGMTQISSTNISPNSGEDILGLLTVSDESDESILASWIQQNSS